MDSNAVQAPKIDCGLVLYLFLLDYVFLENDIKV